MRVIEFDEQQAIDELAAIQRDFDGIANHLAGLQQDLTGLVTDLTSTAGGTATGLDMSSASILSGTSAMMKPVGGEAAEIARLATELAAMLAQK